MALTLTFATSIPDSQSSPSRADFRSALEVVLAASGSADTQGVVNLAFVDEAQARRLNNQFAGNDYATDVLSFNYFEDDDGEPSEQDTIGEVVICTDVAQRQASEHGVSEYSEYILLFVHGVLHLLGYDHSGMANTGFRALQNDIISRLKVDSRDIFDGNIH